MATHFTDFSEYVTGDFPTGWTRAFPSGTILVTNDTGATGGKVLRSSTTSVGATNFATWDTTLVGVGVTQETVVKIRFSNTTSIDTGAVVRYSSTNGYALTPYNASAYVVAKYVSNGRAILGSTISYAFSRDTWYWFRLRVEGSTLSFKVWNDGDAEPGSWAGTRTDSTYTSGYAGIRFSTSAYATRDVDVIGVGTAGSTAPTTGISTINSEIDAATESTTSTLEATWVPSIAISFLPTTENAASQLETRIEPALSVDAATGASISTIGLFYLPDIRIDFPATTGVTTSSFETSWIEPIQIDFNGTTGVAVSELEISLIYGIVPVYGVSSTPSCLSNGSFILGMETLGYITTTSPSTLGIVEMEYALSGETNIYSPTFSASIGSVEYQLIGDTL